MLSRASKYAIRAVLFLSQNSSTKKKYGPKYIANILDVPEAFLAKILQQLARAGIVCSIKGPGGGFFLTEKNRQKHLADILFVIEKENILNSCMMGLPSCGDKNPCPIHHIVEPFKKKLIQKFSVETIGDISQEVAEKGYYLTLNIPDKVL